MKWEILNKDGDRGEVLNALLSNRGITGKKAVEDFLNPPEPYRLQFGELSLSAGQLARALARVKKAVRTKEPIVVYGDYDADGICATAIVWEALRDLGASVMPFIPRREKEGYGLSREGIDEILKNEKYKIGGKSRKSGSGLVVVVDSGVVAHGAVDYAEENGIDVIIIDHHELPKRLPKATAIVHTTKLCASGIAYVFALRLFGKSHVNTDIDKWLELACVATVTDLMPMIGPNRSMVKYGLAALNRTNRVGLSALIAVSGITKVGTYEIGFMIGPRINASGRIENALTALRLLCGSDYAKAMEYAKLLNETNKERQTMTEEMTAHAIQNSEFRIQDSEKRMIIIEHESYHQGVIGLVAGKLVEKYYLPAIVISRGEVYSKASARSIAGFNIISAIRTCEDLLINAGGHPMAAGFTIATAQISNFKFKILNYAREKITDEMLERTLRVDMELELVRVDMNLFQQISQMEPYGIGNPEPVFSGAAEVHSMRTVGQEGKHLKLVVASGQMIGNSQRLDAIAFNQGRKASQLTERQSVEIAYTIALDNFNGGSKLQLKIKDIK